MKKKVLLVEDNPDHQFIAKAHLEAADYETFVVENGVHALKILETEKIDLIVLDLWLPKLDGFSFLKNVKTNSRWAKIPVIITSGVEQLEMPDLADLGVREYFTKPYEPSDLVQAVENVFLCP